MTQSCKICHGTGHVECLNQLCAHWCSCTVCNGTGEVEVYEDWSQGFAEERVRAEEDCKHANKVSIKNAAVASGWYCPDCTCFFSEDMKDKVTTFNLEVEK